MSANKFKVGDKVRVRKGLVTNKYYDDVCCSNTMTKLGGLTLTISYVADNFYKTDECIFNWSDEMLEPAEKTLDNLRAGDFINNEHGTRKILTKMSACYLLSTYEKYTRADSWYTVDDLKRLGYSLVEPDVSEPTIEINGKKYKKADIRKAIKGLEAIDQTMYPACQICGKPTKTINSKYCQGTYCDGKPMEYPSVKKPYTKKKLTRAMIKARRKKGRRKGNR